MTLLYRSPNVVIGSHEWHMTVETHYGRVIRKTLWRPLLSNSRMWKPIHEWQGKRPLWKQFNHAFGKYKLHMQIAEQSVVENARAARQVQREAA